MYFYYYKNGKVSLCSKDRLNSSLSFVEKTLSIDELEKIEQEYLINVVDKKLVFEKSPEITNTELKTLTDKATSIEDLKEIITKMLDK